jgi:hypothetical protein
VRGATLRTTVDAAAQRAGRPAGRPADADAVRSALEEFEAAVARAHRDSGGDTGEHPTPAGIRADAGRPAPGNRATEAPVGPRNDHRPDHHRVHRPDDQPDQPDQPDQLDQPDQPDQLDRTDRTAPSDPSAPSDASDRSEAIADPIAVRDTPHHQNHLPEGAEQ